MSEENIKKTYFEDQFCYFIHKGDTNLKCSKDSYSLDLLGFKDNVPMLVNIKSSKEISCSESLELDPNNKVNESVEVKENDPKRSHSSLSSILQGKKVIIRTNSMSGEKSLIFKQKTGGNVEIPAKLSSLSTEMQIKQELQPEQVVTTPRNVVNMEMLRCKPSILKRAPKKVVKINYCEVKQNKQNDFVKIEQTDLFKEEIIEETKILPFDHDYFNNFSSSGAHEVCLHNNRDPPPLVPISSKQTKDNQVIEITDEEEEENRRDTRQIIPVKLEKNSNKYSEISFDRFHARLEEENKNKNKRLEEENKNNKRSEENNKTNEKKLPITTIDKEQKTIIDSHLLKTPPTCNYEIVNTNLLKKTKEQVQENNNKNTFIVMIANKQMMKGKETQNNNNKIIKATPPSFKIPFRQKLNEHKQAQAAAVPARVFKNVETNTDDFLLEELIEKKMRERALQNKVSKTTNTEEPPPRTTTLEDRITVTPSPLLLSCDPLDILDLLDGPNNNNPNNIIGMNVDFGTGPTMGQIHPSFSGKLISNGKTNNSNGNCANNVVMDISYSRGKNICNGGWSVPSSETHSQSNGWLGGGVTDHNGRPRVESWKLQLFLDLKNCDQFDSAGNMPLHTAVIQNNINLVKRQCLALRTRQIDINTLNHSTYTALQLALMHDASVHIIQLLLQYGADTSVLDPQGSNVLHICVTNSSEAVMKFLLGSTVCANINGTNFEGYTPLILCVLYQKYVQADDLLSTGADPNIADKKSGRTPLFHAVESNDVEMVKLLLNHRAITKVRNFFGTSPHDAMFELDTVDPQIKKLILNKEESSNSKVNTTVEAKGKRKRKADEDKAYTVRPYGQKNIRIKAPRS